MQEGADASGDDAGRHSTGRVTLQQPYRSAYLEGWVLSAVSVAFSTSFLALMVPAHSWRFELSDLAYLAAAVGIGVAPVWMMWFNLTPARCVCLDRATGAIEFTGAFGRRNGWDVSELRVADLRAWLGRPDVLVLQAQGCVPVPMNTGIFGRSRSSAGRWKSRRSASSTTVPIETPRARARRFASFRRCSSIERVVRMMLMLAQRTHHRKKAD